jgi:MFS family permease
MTAFVGPEAESNGATSNHPLAPRMAIIAFLSYNITLGAMHGTYSVFVGPVEAKFGVTRELSTLGATLLMVTLALASPIWGVLASRISMRRLFLIGAAMNFATYALLAMSNSIYLNLAVYALLAGPSIALTGTVLPPALITRWYNVNRGRAMGLATMPIIMAVMAPLAAIVLKNYGMSAAYWVLAGIIALLMIPLCFVVDHPPQDATQGQSQAGAARGDAGMTVPQLLASGRFWALSVAAAAITCGAMVLGFHTVPMVIGWGVDSTRAASLMSVASLAGMIGAVAYGWLADRLGGAATMALMCFISAILWCLMLLQPPFPILLPLVGLIGFNGAAVVPTFSLALAQRFGSASFSRAFGLGMLIALPFNAGGGIFLTAKIYTATGSYAGALVALAAFFVVGTVFALSSRMPKVKPLAAAA